MAKLNIKIIIAITFFSIISTLFANFAFAYNESLSSAEYKKIENEIIGLKNASEAHPSNIHIHMRLGYLYLKINELEKALEQFVAVSRLKPSYYKASLEAGYLYRKIGKDNLAEQEFKKVIKYGDLESKEKAELELEDIIETRYRDKLQELIDKVYEAYNEGNIEEAASYMGNLVKMEPENAQFRLDLCHVYISIGKYEETIKELELLRDKNQLSYEGRIALGFAYDQTDKLELAKKEYNIVAEGKNPRFADEAKMKLDAIFVKSALEAGYLYKKMEKYDLAEQEFKKVAESEYSNAESKKQAELELEDIAKMRYINSLQKLKDNAYEAYNKGETEKAISYFEELIKMEPDNAIPRIDLAYAYISIGKYEEAIKELEFLSDKNQLSYEDRMALGFAYYQIDKTEIDKKEYTIVASGEDIVLADEAKKELEVIRAKIAKDSLIVTEQKTEEIPTVSEEKLSSETIAQAPAETPKATPKIDEKGDEEKLLPVQLDSISFVGTYYERFENTVFDITMRQYLFSEKLSKPLEFYLEENFTIDTKSKGGELPDIYSDNIVEVGLGVRLKPIETEYLYLYGVAAVGQKLIKEDGENQGYGDVRLGINYYKGWGTHYLPETSSKTISYIMKDWGEFGFDISYYNRFDNNIIGYFNIKEGVKILQIKDRDLDVYLLNNTIVDTRGEYYNNFTEIGVGLKFQLIPQKSVYVSFEKIWGFYFGREETDPTPYGDEYNDLRVQIGAYYEW